MIVRIISSLLLLVLVWFAASSNAVTDEFFVDPQVGQPANDGSRSSPWQSLKHVIDEKRLQAGDTVWLSSGDYGVLKIRGIDNIRPVTIAAKDGAVARFSRITIDYSRYWDLQGLNVGPAFARDGIADFIVSIDRHSEHIRIEASTISSATDTSAWSVNDWNRDAIHGIMAAGDFITVRGNLIRNVKHGIHASGDNALIELNIIENFGGDGIRGLGNHSTYQFNEIRNCYAIDDNHDDGFQSWSRGPMGIPGRGEVVGGVIRGNRIVNSPRDDSPLRCHLQGIGMFDGMFVDWIIENNVVIADHWHGITVMGARNVNIRNNTVIDLNTEKPGPPWIAVAKHKDGRISEMSIIANNVTQYRDGEPASDFGTQELGVLETHNLAISDPATVFVDFDGHDLRLRETSPALDAGSADFASTKDILGTPRPQGVGIDVGAYEMR